MALDKINLPPPNKSLGVRGWLPETRSDFRSAASAIRQRRQLTKSVQKRLMKAVGSAMDDKNNPRLVIAAVKVVVSAWKAGISGV